MAWPDTGPPHVASPRELAECPTGVKEVVAVFDLCILHLVTDLLSLGQHRRHGLAREHGPWEPSDRRDGAPIDDILAAGDRGGAIRGEEGYQLGDLGRPARTAQRDAAEGLHQLLARRMSVGAGVRRQSV